MSLTSHLKTHDSPVRRFLEQQFPNNRALLARSRSTLARLSAKEETVTGLLAIPPTHAIDDLCAMSWAFHRHYKDLLGWPVILNLTFEGSRDIGGADADMILDGCLLEIKATTNPRLDTLWLYQFLGYVLLDYANLYGISELAIYMARQQLTLRWPLDQFLATFGTAATLPPSELRTQFRTVIREAEASAL